MASKPRALVYRGDALNMTKITDNSIDLIVTSPPYFGQREYLDDDGNVIVEAVGSEATVGEYLEALSLFMAESWRVLKPSGSVFVNMGDKYEGSGGHNNANIAGERWDGEKRRDAPTRYVQDASGLRRKSLMGLPWRFALDSMQTGWVLRAELIWDKPNGMPESVTDRVRRNHEQWFHFTKEERYFAAVDELREPTTPQSGKAATFKRDKEIERWVPGQSEVQHRPNRPDEVAYSPLGKLPSSVQRISTGGSRPTKDDKAKYNLPSHFAPFPPEWPRFFILGWSPVGWCGKCGEAIAPIRGRDCEQCGAMVPHQAKSCPECEHKRDWKEGRVMEGAMKSSDWSTPGHGTPRHPGNHKVTTQLYGYGCSCEGESSDISPSVVLDPFAGTGTTALVARLLGRASISLDISDAYIRLINWRLRISDHDEKLVKKWKKKGLL